MISRRALVTAMAETLRNIPELIGVLSGPEHVKPYIDYNPSNNSVEKALYQMQPGQLLVIWWETLLIEETMGRWTHRVKLCARAKKDHSDMDLGDLIMQGVPVPGDGLIWRLCPIMPGVYPTNVGALTRETDTEGVDYAVILTDTAETGDWPYP